MAGLVNPFAFIGGEAAEGLLLDQISSTSAIACSLRKLRAGYTGDCITISNLDNSAESDIGFVGNFVDTASIASFAATNGDAYVLNWYDQSGNQTDFASNNLSFAPLICSSSGAFYEVDGIKTIANYKSRMGFNNGTSGWTGTSNTHTLFYVTTKANNGGGASVTDKYLISGTGAASVPALISNYSSKAFEQFYNGSNERSTLQTTADDNLHLLGIRRDSTAATPFAQGYFDGDQEYQDNSITAALTGDFRVLGAFTNTDSNKTSNNIGEFIIWNSYLSDEDLTTVNNNIKNYYSIT